MIPHGFKPNLAATLTKPELIEFPVWASPKIDGIRCVFFGGVAYSRSLKPIPNPVVQGFAKAYEDVLEGLDGELVVGNPNDPNVMQQTTSGVMSKSAEPDFTFWVFDWVPAVQAAIRTEHYGYRHRSDEVEARLIGASLIGIGRIRAVPQHFCTCAEDLDTLEARFLADGYEGMMIRAHDGKYKYGRSTEREGGLVKVKRFVDGEAVIVGFEEEMHNANEATRNATGRTERSTAQAGLVGKETLGALVVRRVDERDNRIPVGAVFNIGTGFTAAQRRDLWRRKGSLVGQFVKFKHFDHGTVDAPRHPVFIGLRHPEDM
ncbi:ATP-dependent DNA ligase [Burkholderia cenocepacia]